MTKKFEYVRDTGHGWVTVTMADLADVGLKPEDFSEYSYKKADGVTFHLEEDCDANAFAKAYKAKYGTDPEFEITDLDHRSSIRRLQKIK